MAQQGYLSPSGLGKAKCVPSGETLRQIRKEWNQPKERPPGHSHGCATMTATHSSSCKTENSVPRKQEATAPTILLSYSEFDFGRGRISKEVLENRGEEVTSSLLYLRETRGPLN